MSGLLGKLANQVSGQNPSQASQGGSSGIMHKVQDTITGQKHPQDLQGNWSGRQDNFAQDYYPERESFSVALTFNQLIKILT